MLVVIDLLAAADLDGDVLTVDVFELVVDAVWVCETVDVFE